MDETHKTIKDSEVRVALLVEEAKSSKAVTYRELTRRKLVCRLLHKEHIIEASNCTNKFYYCCHKCSTVWPTSRKKK